jgi:hypothetical protein
VLSRPPIRARPCWAMVHRDSTQARADKARQTQGRGGADPTEVSRQDPRKLIAPACWLSSRQVICEKAEKSDIPTIDKKKYLVPAVSRR